MKKKKQKSKTLQQLTRVWDKRLKDAGFVDIENRRTGLLKKTGGDVVWSPEAFDHAMPKTQGKGYTTLAWKESQAEYYRLAGHALHEKEFKNIKLRLIWQLHSEGLTYVEIAEALNTTLDKVRRSVEKLAHEFCLK